MSKKGKWIGSRVKRYMKLDGTILSNHHSPEASATWQVSIKDASFSSSPKRKKLVIELYDARMELYCDTKAEVENWMEAFAQARKSLQNREEGKENLDTSANSKALQDDLNNDADDRTIPIDALSMSFKVIKPVVRKFDSEENESDDDGAYDPDDNPKDDENDHQPLNGPRIYEETPNSMIFKQFAFNPPKKS